MSKRNCLICYCLICYYGICSDLKGSFKNAEEIKKFLSIWKVCIKHTKALKQIAIEKAS